MAKFKNVEKLLKDAGINPTSQRLAIADYVLNIADHPTADDVKRWADENLPKVSLATVYNTLNTFHKHGIVREVRLPHTEKAVFDPNIDPHYHVVLEDGTIIDIPIDSIQISDAIKARYDIDHIELSVYGKEVIQQPLASNG